MRAAAGPLAAGTRATSSPTPPEPVLAPARGASWWPGPRAGLALLWLAGTCAVLARLAVGLAASRRARRAGRDAPPEIRRFTERCAARLGIARPVRLVMGCADAMPATWGLLRPTLLLPVGAVGWGRERLEVVLLHELAHVRRGDWATQLAAELALALHWPNPLVWLAVRRLRAEQEHACDDAVLAAGSGASDYAAHLLAIARSLRPARAPAALAMARPSRVGGRIRAVLEERRSRGDVRARHRAVAATAAVLVGLPLAAAAPAPSSGPVPGIAAVAADTTRCDLDGPRSFSHEEDGGSHRLRWRAPGCSGEARIEEPIEFAADLSGVSRIERGGRLWLRTNDGRHVREVDVVAAADGRPRHDYRVDDRPRALDEGGRAWLGGALADLVPELGIDVPGRVATLLRTGGPAAVLAEMERIGSDHVTGLYARELLRVAELAEPELVALARLVARRIGSDHELGGVLRAVAARGRLTPPVRTALLDAAGTIGSDHELALVLTPLIAADDLDEAGLAQVLVAARAIGSDHELAELLLAVIRARPVSGLVRDAFLETLDTVGSDHDHGRVATALLRRTS